jgi:hypothetical protein
MKKQLLLNALGVVALSLVCACGSQTEAPKSEQKEVPAQEEKKGTEVAVNTEAPVTAPTTAPATDAAQQTAQAPTAPATDAAQQTAQAPTAPTTEQKA